MIKFHACILPHVVRMLDIWTMLNGAQFDVVQAMQMVVCTSLVPHMLSAEEGIEAKHSISALGPLRASRTLWYPRTLARECRVRPP